MRARAALRQGLCLQRLFGGYAPLHPGRGFALGPQNNAFRWETPCVYALWQRNVIDSNLRSITSTRHASISSHWRWRPLPRGLGPGYGPSGGAYHYPESLFWIRRAGGVGRIIRYMAAISTSFWNPFHNTLTPGSPSRLRP